MIWKGTWVPDQSSRTLRLTRRPVFTVPTRGEIQVLWMWILGDQDHQTTTDGDANCDDGERFSVGEPTMIIPNG